MSKKRGPPSQGGNRKGHEKDAKEKKHEKSTERLTVTREATVAKDRPSDPSLMRVATSGNQSDRSESFEDAERCVFTIFLPHLKRSRILLEGITSDVVALFIS